jgi:hypothetical protein
MRGIGPRVRVELPACEHRREQGCGGVSLKDGGKGRIILEGVAPQFAAEVTRMEAEEAVAFERAMLSPPPQEEQAGRQPDNSGGFNWSSLNDET